MIHADRDRLAVRAARVAVSVIVGCATSCSKPPETDRVEVIPARGSIFCDGQPAAGAVVYFHPQETAASNFPKPHAIVDDQGAFEISTYESGDGAPPGRYNVTVSWRLVEEGQGLKAEDRDEAPERLPVRYQDPGASGLVVDVKQGATEFDPIRLSR